MTISAAFTVDGNANPDAHEVAYGATVELELDDTSGAHSITWAIVACSDPDEALPALTVAGTPAGKTAEFDMPPDSGDGLGRTFLVSCTVTTDRRGAGGSIEEAVEHGVIGAVSATGLLPIVPGEENYAHGTHGWAPRVNRVLAGVGGSGTGGLAQPHDTTHTPVALWQFNNTLVDTAGGSLDFALLAGVTRYTEMLPGLPAVNIFTNVKYRHNVVDTALKITGDVTILMWIRFRAYTAGAIISYDTNGENEADNYLYAIALTGGSTQLQFTSESGSGTNAEHNIDYLPPLYQPVHLAVRRASNVVQFFLNGKPFGPASSALTTPTGGGNSKPHIGWVANDAVDCDLASLKVEGSALTNAQILAENNRTAGPFYGFRT